METIQTKRTGGSKLKFAVLYLVSVALVVFIVSLFWPRNGPDGAVTAANPLDTNSGFEANELLSKVETLTAQYKTLKSLDQEYSNQAESMKDPAAIRNFTEPIAEAENTLTATLDNLAKTARNTSDPKQALRLQQFIESFRLVLADRSAMNAYKTAVMASGNANAGQQAIIKLQADLTERNGRITALENQIRTLETKGGKVVASTADRTEASQSETEVLKATIATQEKKIAGLTAANTSLEKSNAESESAKKGADNSTALKNQNALLEKKVSDLTADLRLALVDCNLTRADAAQIISNSKQRKNLLAEALGILNNLSATGDAAVKSKVAEKLVRLNKVASTMHD